MKIHFAVYRGVSGDDDRYGRFVSEVQRYGGVEDWSATLKFSLGDLALFYFSEPVRSIVAIGFVASKLRTHKGRWDWTDRKEATFCDFFPIWLLKKKAPLKETCYHIGLKEWYQTRPFRHSHQLRPNVAQRLLSEIASKNPDIQKRISKFDMLFKQSTALAKKPRLSSREFSEGGVKEITVELQRRNPQLRAQALAVYGESCRVCGFNFGDSYGELGAGYIEVHHLKPLSERRSAHNATVEDVEVVCANCHRVLHRNGKRPISLDELRKVLKRRSRAKGAGQPNR